MIVNTITITLTVGLIAATLYYLIARAYIDRLARARARVNIRTRLHQHLNRRADPDVQPRELTDNEKAWVKIRIDLLKARMQHEENMRRYRENALAPYDKTESA